MHIQIVYTVRSIAWDMDSECRQVYIDIADSDPALKRIVRKKIANEELTEIEKTIYRAYHKKCNEVKFNIDGKELRAIDILGQCQRDILASWGFYEKDRDLNKIAKAIGLIENA